MAGGDASKLHTGVWWDLNTCPLPSGVDPLCVRRCIETALLERIGRPSAFSIYAMGNLEYISSDFMEMLAYSGIVLIHAPCGVMELCGFLQEWSKSIPKGGYTMLISDDHSLANPSLFQIFPQFTNFCAYPKLGRLLALAEQSDPRVLTNEFVWETLLYDHFANTDMTVRDVTPLYICNTCDTCYKVFDIEEFITHLKSDEHRKESLDIVPKDPCNGEPKHFCQVCNYPAYDEFNLRIHNQSEEHSHKLVEKETQEEEGCPSRKSPFDEHNKSEELSPKLVEKETQEEEGCAKNLKRSPEWGPSDEINKKQSLDRGKQ